MPELDFAHDVKVDKHNLEEEWEQQAELALSYSQEEASAQKVVADLKVAVEEAKEAVKNEENRVYLDAVDNPEKYGLGKTTGDCLKAVADTHTTVVEKRQQYHKLQRELNEADHTLARIHGATVAVTTDRRQALSHIVDLWGRGYFGTPTSDVSGTEKRDAGRQSANYKYRRTKNDE